MLKPKLLIKIKSGIIQSVESDIELDMVILDYDADGNFNNIKLYDHNYFVEEGETDLVGRSYLDKIFKDVNDAEIITEEMEDK